MLKGKTEPRIFTQPLRPLTSETSLGFAFADFCDLVCNMPLIPWQKWLAVHGLEIIGDLAGEWHFRFRTVIVLVARQQGKSKFLELLNLFFLYVLGTPLTVGTAQNLDTAEEVWEGAVEIAESVPDLKAEIATVARRNGGKALKLLSGSRYKIVAASRSGGRGLSSDLVSMDELREQRDWDAWGAVTKTTMARPNAQVWGFSNAGDPSSVVLRRLRLQCHAALGDPDGAVRNTGGLIIEAEEVDDTLGLFEWSAPPGCDIRDEEAIAQANPSLGYGFVTMRALLSAASTDPEAVFRTECLCQWVEAMTASKFPEGAWEEALNEGSEIVGGYVFGIDVSADRRRTAIAVCGMNSAGQYHVELVAYRSGITWAVDWIRQRADKKNPIRLAYQAKGAAISANIEEFEAMDGVELVPCEGRDLPAWCSRFYDSVVAAIGEGDAVALRHLDQPALDRAAKVAQTRKIGDGAWAWDRANSPEDISPLFAANMAFGAFSAKAAPNKRKYRSAYEDEGRTLIVV